MPKISYDTEGGFSKGSAWLDKIQRKVKNNSVLDKVEADGIKALSAATPVGETGQTAAGWQGRKKKTGNGGELNFINVAHPQESVNIAKIKELGHGTGTGGYVPPKPYMKQAMEPVWAKVNTYLREELSK